MKSLVVAAVLSIPSLVAAQPGPSEDPPAATLAPAPAAPVVVVQQAPQNVPWSELSHINGQLVPVGGRNEYFTNTLKKTNISVNPIGALFGFYGASVSYALSNNIAIRGDVEVFDVSGMKGSEFDVTLPIYLRKTYTGLFVEPGLMVRTLYNTYDDYDSCYGCASAEMTSTTDTAIGPEVMIGYHYMTDSGFNVAAAFGAMRNLNHSSNESSDEIDVQPAGYFRVGYAF